MRKLLIAFALIPATSQAALVIDDGAAQKPAQPVSTIQIQQPPTTAAVSSTVAAIPLAQVTDAANPALSIAPVWKINATDGTFQKLFARWSAVAGWTFVWDVDQDIPLVGVDSFSTSFTDAVLKVAHSTDGTDMPIHPCFYTNNLVRIVPVSVVCNPDNN